MKGDFHVRFCERLAGEISAFAYSTEIVGKVITRTSVRPLTVSYNPNCVQSRPNFAKPLRCYLQAERPCPGNTLMKEKIKKK